MVVQCPLTHDVIGLLVYTCTVCMSCMVLYLCYNACTVHVHVCMSNSISASCWCVAMCTALHLHVCVQCVYM